MKSNKFGPDNQPMHDGVAVIAGQLPAILSCQKLLDNKEVNFYIGY
jgi:hypothetical protein